MDIMIHVIHSFMATRIIMGVRCEYQPELFESIGIFFKKKKYLEIILANLYFFIKKHYSM